MNSIKINSRHSAEAAVKSTQYIVGSVDAAGNVSFSTNPVLQCSASQARQECRRLARLRPGTTFIFAQLRGAERVLTQPTEFSI